MPDKEIYRGMPIGIYESAETFYSFASQLIPRIKVDNIE